MISNPCECLSCISKYQANSKAVLSPGFSLLLSASLATITPALATTLAPCQRLGHAFNQRLTDVKFPSGLKLLSFGMRFNQSLLRVELPKLDTLSLPCDFTGSLEHLEQNFGSLKELTLGGEKKLQHVNLPISLQSLTFLPRLSQSLHEVKWPSNLQHLTLGGFVQKRCTPRSGGFPITSDYEQLDGPRPRLRFQ